MGFRVSYQLLQIKLNCFRNVIENEYAYGVLLLQIQP